MPSAMPNKRHLQVGERWKLASFCSWDKVSSNVIIYKMQTISYVSIPFEQGILDNIKQFIYQL